MKNAIKTAGIISLVGNTVSIGGGIGGGIAIGKLVKEASESTGLGVGVGIVSGITIFCVGSAITSQIVKATCADGVMKQAENMFGGMVNAFADIDEE